MRAMESDYGVLLSIAEVAAAFAGFAALAGILGRYSLEAVRLDFERLKTVVVISMLVVITALLPIVLQRFHIEPALAWQLASGIAMLLNWAVLVIVYRAGRRSGLHRADRYYTWIGYTLEVPVEIALVISTLGLAPDYAPALYLTFLFLCLCQAVMAFLLLLTSLFQPASVLPPD